EALALPTDVGNPTEVKKAFSEIQQQWGRMDILINNAGVVEPIAPLVKCRDDALLQSLQTNVYGTYLCTREALKHMMEENREEGTIINITSGAAKKPYHGWSAYSSQKAAVDMFTRCVALEVKELPIRIAAIAPGTFESNMQELIRSKSEEDFPARPKFVKLHQEGHLSKPEDVAKSIVAIALSDWPELSGRITDIRSSEFQEECRRRGIEIRGV
ncbi:MAG: SDR family NAD(P)-dependent oxidoreductase, partial [Aliifodinibius sp.]|nr:SDR family NAD(P)-dependent oxidoreductase [Fodinibius sp.]NIX00974.1 SDR family NAD(P)-dependent oxidoreductase [Phycisphaerae bacterium]NIY30204.1 SDR family NAD(P)-dependent oxidoreductase [Fodinibius sp.]